MDWIMSDKDIYMSLKWRVYPKVIFLASVKKLKSWGSLALMAVNMATKAKLFVKKVTIYTFKEKQHEKNGHW